MAPGLWPINGFGARARCFLGDSVFDGLPVSSVGHFTKSDISRRLLRQVRTPYAMRQPSPFSRLEQWAGRAVALGGAMSSSWPMLMRFVREVQRHSAACQAMSNDEIADHAIELSRDLKATGMAKPVVAEAFALVREVAGRTLGQRHYDVQVAGGWAMLNGMVAEMQTGEGKTLSATLPACVAALAGIPVHIITVNDYLAERDAKALQPLYAMLGLSCTASLAQMSEQERRAAYRGDIVYTTNKQVAFDHLRDRIKLRGRASQIGLNFAWQQEDALLLRGLHYAIVDEVDSVLIDEAATPLIISRRGTPLYPEAMLVQALEVAGTLQEGRDYVLKPQQRNLKLLEQGRQRLRAWSCTQQGLWQNTRYREHLAAQALRALFLFERDRHYLIDDGKVKIVDEFTGRVMEDRSWEQGLHQLIECKEGCAITGEMETIGRISYQTFFRRYLMLAGMSGTVKEVAGELHDVYGLRVARIPTHRPVKRKAFPSDISLTDEAKWRRVVDRVSELHRLGRPVLIGTRSVNASEHLSALLRKAGMEHNVLNARQDAREAEIVAAAGRAGQITVATNMAGRGTDIRLGDRVDALGGLHVIATEKHEARRIDRQLFGRCGRQGDPGSYEQLAALSDDLFRVHAPRTRVALARMALRARAPFSQALARALLRAAQRRAEAASRRARTRMQQVDEYLGNVLAFTGQLE